MPKVLCLGNEFIGGDSLAKEIGQSLKKDFEVVNVSDSFQLMSLLKEANEGEIVLLDVVQGLKDVQILGIEDLRNDSILSAHDFDAGYVIKLIGKNFKIIGIPIAGDAEEIKKEVLGLLG